MEEAGVLGVEEGMSFAFEEAVTIPVNGNHMCLKLSFPAGLVFMLESTFHSGRSCSSPWSCCAGRALEEVSAPCNVNMNWSGRRFEVNLGRLCTSPLKRSNLLVNINQQRLFDPHFKGRLLIAVWWF